MANVPSYDEMTNLAEKAEMLLMNHASMQTLLQQNSEALDKVKCSLGSNPSYKAVQNLSLPEPAPEFILSDFLDKSQRDRSFDLLKRKVDAIQNRTALLRQFYNRSTQQLNRLSYDLYLPEWTHEFSDLQDMLTNIKAYSNIIKEIRSILLKN